MLPDTVSTACVLQNTQRFGVCSVEELKVPKLDTVLAF